GLLDPAVAGRRDGGGIVNAQLHPSRGRELVANSIAGFMRSTPGLTLMERTVNGQPGLIAERDGVIATVLAFDVADGLITNIWAVLNPEKLR
ncbi:RNA polymerase subunit sigma-24, partial [Streptomyces beijiangensis]|nr:RNA polymerase subunit sigma-24 [Streptomyces beijiangensis]